jgi:hypothetical protein
MGAIHKKCKDFFNKSLQLQTLVASYNPGKPNSRYKAKKAIFFRRNAEIKRGSRAEILSFVMPIFVILVPTKDSFVHLNGEVLFFCFCCH